MIDEKKLQLILADYKRDFVSKQWARDRCKWEAVKHFQDRWDINAPDFGGMFARATEEAAGLLASGHSCARDMILRFAAANTEAARSMFLDLFDESRGLSERVERFESGAEAMRVKYGDGTWKQHYQNAGSISIYLWLRYPDRYYIYKYAECYAAAQELGSAFIPKRGASSGNLQGCFHLYDEVCAALVLDKELVRLLQSVLTEECHPDKALKTLTTDVIYYISRMYAERGAGRWFPAGYSPDLKEEDWLALLANETVFTKDSLAIMKRMKDYGGKATCTQLAGRYGETKAFYSRGSSALARRVASAAGCPLYGGSGETGKWWPVLYTGRRAGGGVAGSYVWRLRGELSRALDRVDLSAIPLYAETAGRPPYIWKISHGTDHFTEEEAKGFKASRVVVVHKHTKAKAISKVSQGENFMHTMRRGDFFYLCYGNSIRLLGQITSDEAAPSRKEGSGWYQRGYAVIAESSDLSPYRNRKKWWTPNDNSTCIAVGESDRPLFERLILKPYFNMTLAELLGGAEDRGYWWLNASPKTWSFSAVGAGETQEFPLYNDNGNRRRVFQNFLDVRAGDLMIGYESHPVKQVVAIARVARGSDGEGIRIEKLEGLASPVDYAVLKSSADLKHMEFFANPHGSLFRLAKSEFDCIMDLIREENPLRSGERAGAYGKKQFLEEVYMPGEQFDTLVSLLRHKKNLILQGAPGVGKTFVAKRLAYAMMREADEDRVQLIQFHQSCSYEDFVMGYKPQGAGFQLQNGVFYQFCKRAENMPGKPFFFIIDEINRGNVSRIFGELLMLIERDYRGTRIALSCNGIPFAVPQNLYLIGMMNTADRGLTAIDYALRRRFSFFEMEPAFRSEGFRAYQAGLASGLLDDLIDRIVELNQEIAADPALGTGFRIGHSCFCGQQECTEEWLREVVAYEILPVLREYWFDEPERLQRWENVLRGVFHD